MPLSSTKCHNWIFFSTIWVVLQQHIWHKTITEQHGRLWDSLPIPPPSSPGTSEQLRPCPGLANPPLEGVRLARLSSVHRVKRSVCPKEPVNTSLSDLLHSTANVKPHYPPLNGVPDPIFTNGHKAWSPWSTVVCRLTPSPSLLAGRGRLCPGLRPAQSEKLWHSFFEFAQIAARKRPVLVKMNWKCSQN